MNYNVTLVLDWKFQMCLIILKEFLLKFLKF